MAASPSTSSPLRIVIAGGGIAAVEALIALYETSPRRLAMTLVSASDMLTYRPSALGEPFGLGPTVRYPLSTVCADHGGAFIHARVDRVRPGEHEVDLDDGRVLGYDILVVAVGARTVPAYEHGTTFDPAHALDDFDELLRDVAEGLAPSVAIIVPGSVSWTLPAYELALMTARHETRTPLGKARVSLVTHEPTPLAVFGPTASAMAARVMDEAGVAVRTGVRPHLLSATAMHADGVHLAAHRLVSLPHVQGPAIPGLPCDGDGFVRVDEFGRVPDVADVYAAGDGTTLPIKQGGLAAQLADVVAWHIVSTTTGERDPEPLRPILRGLLRTADGPRYLLADLSDPEGTSTWSDQPLWWPASRIASRWASPYLARLDAAHARKAALVSDAPNLDRSWSQSVR
jgi:sulfide:quinone oxidoreductase